jgi:hypothetical protein
MDWIHTWYFMIPFGISSIAIFNEDQKYREIRIIWPVLLLAMGLLGPLLTQTTIPSLDILLNFLYLNILFACVFLTQILQGYSVKSIINKKIGIGDLVISYCLILFFNTSSFMVFIPSASALVLVYQFSFPVHSKIPFAGNIMALAFLWILSEWYWGPVLKIFFFQ